MLPFLNTQGRDAIEFDYSEFRPYSKFGETAGASMRSQARVTLPGEIALELNVDENVRAEMEQSPETRQAWEEYKGKITGLEPPSQAKTSEDFLPKYTDREELRAKMAEKGKKFSDDVEIPKEGLSLARAEAYQERYEREMADRQIMENARPGLSGLAAKLGGGLVGSLADPINYIPLANGLSRARTLIRGTSIFSSAGVKTLAKSAVIGAAEGVGGALLSDAVNFPLANRWGADMGFEDLLADVTLGALLGAGLSVAGTAFGPRLFPRPKEAAEVAADLLSNIPADAIPILEPLLSGRAPVWQYYGLRNNPEVIGRVRRQAESILDAMPEGKSATGAARDALLSNIENRLWGQVDEARRAIVPVLAQNRAGLVDSMASAIGPRKTTALIQDSLVKAAADDRAGRAVDVGGIIEPAVRATEARLGADGSMSFERAGPDAVETAATKFAAESAERAKAAEVRATQDVDPDVLAFDEAVKANAVAPETVEAARVIDFEVAQMQRERLGRAEAVECFLANGV